MVDQLILVFCLQLLEWNVLQQIQSLLISLDLMLQIVESIAEKVLELVLLFRRGKATIITLLEYKEVILVLLVPLVGVHLVGLLSLIQISSF